jgi:hypothetical protein
MPEDWAVLYMEFALFAMRHPVAQRKLVEFDNAAIAEVAELITQERVRWGLEELESAESIARITQALFRGISLMRALDPDAVDEAFLASALSFVTGALTTDES